MTDLSPLSVWRRFLALPNDSAVKTLGVAFLVALASAVTVSMTSVALKPRQIANIEAAREAKFAAMIAELPGLEDILREAGAETLQAVLVALDTGQIDAGADTAGYDYVAAQSDPDQTTALPPEADIAGLARRPTRAPAYILRGVDGLALVVLPVYGRGYQSTIRAYLALEGDLNTIAALNIYEQADTPGLGSRVADPQWLGQWSGKQVADAAGDVMITVVRSGTGSVFEVDGITGATRSSMGVSNLVQFWLGPLGYGPFLDRLKTGDF